LRWIHLRKLMPLEDVIAGLERGGVAPLSGSGSSGVRASTPAGASAARPAPSAPRPPYGSRPDFSRKPAGPQATIARLQEARSAAAAATAIVAAPIVAPDRAASPQDAPAALPLDLPDRFLAELKRVKAAFYGMVVAQAQTVECDDRRLILTFAPQHDHLRAQIDARRTELEQIALQVGGRRVPIITVRGVEPSPNEPAPLSSVTAAPPPDAAADLRARAMADENVQALLEIFPAEIRDIEEL
jgi:hypothetical protein